MNSCNCQKISERSSGSADIPLGCSFVVEVVVGTVSGTVVFDHSLVRNRVHTSYSAVNTDSVVGFEDRNGIVVVVGLVVGLVVGIDLAAAAVAAVDMLGTELLVVADSCSPTFGIAVCFHV